MSWKRARQGHLGAAVITIAAGAAFFLAWQIAGTLLLIFAGLLFGSLLDACTRGLGFLLPVNRNSRLGLVCMLLGVGAAWLLVWSGTNLAVQADSLVQLLGDQTRVLKGHIQSLGLAPPQNSEPPRTLAQLLFPDPGALFGTAYSAFNLASGMLGNVVMIVFIGLFTAASPETYRRGLLRLFPRERRSRLGEVLDEMAAAMRWWLVGQLIAGIMIAISTAAGLALIGMPGALLLGLQAGLFNFIPYLGPVIAAGPIILAAMSISSTMVLWAAGMHVIIQSIEGYVLAPMIQKRAVDLPPVLSLAAVLIFGALFGALGVALATPLVAALKVAVIRLYVEDKLEGGSGEIAREHI